MVTDRLTDRLGAESILSVSVNLTVMEMRKETVRVNEESLSTDVGLPQNNAFRV